MTGLVSDFLPALRDPSLAPPAGLLDGAGRPAGRRFDVYRNNVTVSLIAALEVGFPAVRSLLGPENFGHIAKAYAVAHPPDGPLMMQYGQGFPAWLAAEQALAHLSYLPDVARLELAMRASYHAADHVALTPDDLARIPPETLADTRFFLAPSVHLLRSAWPVADIHRFALAPDGPKPAGGAQDIAVIRPEFDPEVHVLSPGGHAFVAALQETRPLGQAADAATRAFADFDLGAVLSLLVQHRALMKGPPAK